MIISYRVTYIFFMIVGFLMAMESLIQIETATSGFISVVFIITFTIGLTIACIASFLFGASFKKTKYDAETREQE